MDSLDRWSSSAPTAVHLGEGTIWSQKHFTVELIAAGFPASMKQDMGQVTQTLTWRTKVGDVRPWAFFRKP